MNERWDGAQFLIGPLNTASQAFSWANAVSSHSNLSSKSFAQDGYFSRRLRRTSLTDRAHVSVPHRRISLALLRRRYIDHLFRQATHHLNESNSPLFGDPHRGSFGSEVPRFADKGLSLAVVFHGSDIRDPTRHALENEFSYFRDAPKEWSVSLDRVARKNRLAAQQMGLPVFVSTPDLLADLPMARLLPLAVDIDYWTADSRLFSHPRPRVLHLPSQGRIKGTPYIESALFELDQEGAIDWIRSDSVPRTGVRRLLRESDVVIDQIQTGSYGVAAIEAMSCGRLVVGNVSQFVSKVLGEEVPIVNANPPTIKRVILDLLNDHEWARRQAALGQEFVERWHGGRASALALDPFLAGGAAHRMVG
jgi:hypothetical protein